LLEVLSDFFRLSLDKKKPLKVAFLFIG